MTGPAAPTLTVRYDGSSRNFAPGNDIVVGRDLRADVRIAHPLISRAHLILRFDRGRWLAIDNGSLNGLFVNGRRVPTIEIGDGTAVNIGNPDGPQLTFGVGRHTGTAGRTPATSAIPMSGGVPSAGMSSGGMRPPSAANPTIAPPRQYPTGARPPVPSGPVAPPVGNAPTMMGPAAAPRGGDGANLATSMLKMLRPGRGGEAPPGSIKIGRATDNDIVIPDVLASRHHATLITGPSGTQILDNRSINGTFVNGSRVDSAQLRSGDASLLIWALAVLTLFIVLQVETARMPIDDPTTHLELTMVHEVMILDHSGPDLAAIQLGAALKLQVGAAILATLLNPFAREGGPLAAAVNLVLCVLIAALVGTVESLIARLRLRTVPKYIAVALASAAVALLATAWRDGA